MIATARLGPDELQILHDVKRDRIAAARPAQLAERAALVARLAPDPAAAKQEQAHDAELKSAERAVTEARKNLERTMARVSELWRASHGRSHGQHASDEAARSRLRALTHPAAAVVWRALVRASYNTMSVPMSVLGVEHVEEEIPATAEESRRSWFRPFIRETIRPVTSHHLQVALLAALGVASARVEDLAYQDLDDTATIAALRGELDSILRVQVPTNFWHIRDALAVLRQKLNGDPLSLWTIEEQIT